MNCSDVEKRIYLYPELTQRQRGETDRHMAACSSCRNLMNRINDERAILQRILQVPDVLPDNAAITNRVISAVRDIPQKKVSRFVSLFESVYTPMRYAMSLLSVFLVVTFLNEHHHVLKSPPPATVFTVAEKKTELNSSSFYEALAKPNKKTTRQLVYECVVRCLRTSHTDCAGCRVQFSKLNEVP